MPSPQTPSYAQVHQIGPGAPGVAPERPTLEMPELPEQERPEYDESQVQRLAREHAAPGVRTLREAYQTAASRLPSDPRSRLTLRSALKGYGSGLESVMGGARKTARAEYGQKYGAEVGFAREQYAAQVGMAQTQARTQAQMQQQQFQMSYADYLKRPESREGGYYTGGGPRPTWVEPYTVY